MTKAEKWKTIALFPVVLLIAIVEPMWDGLKVAWPGWKENFANVWNIYTKEIWNDTTAN